MALNQWKNYNQNLLNAINSINEKDILNLIKQVKPYIGTRDEIHILGNGGSAANANHINGDFSKTFSSTSETIKINSFADNSCYITAASNDIDFSEVFTLLIPGRINKKDLIIFLSGSGNSINLVKCAQKARDFNINTFAITGYNGGKLKDICNHHIHVPIKDMEIIEDIQLIIFHFIKQYLTKEFKKNGNFKNLSPKYEKRTISNEIA
tara:strand:- start:395 stop:1021 length:627 start_codon:yes stop_codon:yes gene_type:complete